MRAVDLHVHSTKSDGSLTPSELVDYAISKNLAAFALTDHDSIDGLEEAISYAKGKPIEVIPGIEFSTEYQGRDIHIVGIYFDYENPAFLSRIQTFRDSRTLRNEKMCRRLQEEGIDITYEKLLAENPDAVITRSHYAEYLFRHGYIKNRKEAFERYIGDHCKCFVPREKITPAGAVKLILEFGGIPILAHPVLYHMTKGQLDTLVSELKAAGLVAIEAVYSTYAPADEREMKRLAEKYDLLVSGGSDYHGDAKPGLELATGYGKLFVPEELLDKMKQYLADRDKPKNIFFTDMDGTLLNDEKIITPKTRAALDEFLAKGNVLALSSGRPLNSILEVVEKSGLCDDNLYAIAYNGTLIYHCKTKTIARKKTLPLRLLPEIQSICQKEGIYCQTYDDTSILAPAMEKETQYYIKTIHLPVKIVPDFSAITEPPCKMLCIELTDTEKLRDFSKKLQERYEGQISCVLSRPTLLEIFPADAGKGNAVKELCQMLSVPLTHSYAAGDEQNDISMLEAAQHGIAMANATDAVKAAADYVCDFDNNHDGLAEFFKQATTNN
ncbi:MAG: Cof-type HAD-IIB family hydrolase [Lachnospiraceae bacterium]|nr:Cof-type HAD-IIB family hydrolase [Lachnospiraceae bacterium]